MSVSARRRVVRLMQPRAEVLLEVGDEPRDHGGRQVHGARRIGEAAFVDDAREHAHGLQSVHCSYFSNDALNHR